MAASSPSRPATTTAIGTKRMRSLKRINTPAEHAAALARIDALVGATPESPEEDELALLADLVEEYERTHFPVAERDDRP
jgi:antitoxin component HigA of HigAB toxin-antitoxin module